jgi:hypothetical protein
VGDDALLSPDSFNNAETMCIIKYPIVMSPALGHGVLKTVMAFA